jgi:hypothetical protein
MFDTWFGAMLVGFSAILIGRIDDFYQHVCDLLAWSEEKLVRYAGGDVDDIAGFDWDTGSFRGRHEPYKAAAHHRAGRSCKLEPSKRRRLQPPLSLWTLGGGG